MSEEDAIKGYIARFNEIGARLNQLLDERWRIVGSRTELKDYESGFLKDLKGHIDEELLIVDQIRVEFDKAIAVMVDFEKVMVSMSIPAEQKLVLDEIISRFRHFDFHIGMWERRLTEEMEYFSQTIEAAEHRFRQNPHDKALEKDFSDKFNLDLLGKDKARLERMQDLFNRELNEEVSLLEESSKDIKDLDEFKKITMSRSKKVAGITGVATSLLPGMMFAGNALSGGHPVALIGFGMTTLAFACAGYFLMFNAHLKNSIRKKANILGKLFKDNRVRSFFSSSRQ